MYNQYQTHHREKVQMKITATFAHALQRNYTLLTVATAECIGIFGLVFAGCGAIIIDTLSHGAITHIGVSLTFGLVVTAMIFATGHISGAHLNPAVTLGFTVTKHLSIQKMLVYWAAQFSGAIAAVFALKLLFGGAAKLGATIPSGSDMQSFALEVILTFFLMFVIMVVATDSRAKSEFAPIAIGATVALEALFTGPISGASMNPFRSLAPALLSGYWNSQWIYLTAPFIGAAAAAILYTWLNNANHTRGTIS